MGCVDGIFRSEFYCALFTVCVVGHFYIYIGLPSCDWLSTSLEALASLSNFTRWNETRIDMPEQNMRCAHPFNCKKRDCIVDVMLLKRRQLGANEPATVCFRV